MRCALLLPINAHDPPPSSIVEKLDAVDSAHEGLGIRGIMARFVGAPSMGDLAKTLGLTRDFLFIEGGLFEKGSTRDESLDIQNLRRQIAIRSAGLDRDRHQTRTREVKRAFTIPIALASGRAGNSIVSSGDDRVD